MHIILGISGSIAAYKTPDLVRLFKRAGVQVTPVLTDNAQEFVAPLSLETVAEVPVHSAGIQHLSHRQADALVIAPATANVIAKIAAGIGDDLLTTTVLSFTGPKLIVPAMHDEMWHNPITQRNVQTLRSFGFHFLGPDYGDLACGERGQGRMVDAGLIVLRTLILAFPELDLSGHRILITSGGTREALDPVRVLTNLSTGQLGETLAHCAASFGAEVTLISTGSPVLCNPALQRVLRVSSVADLQVALMAHFPDCDTLIMAAAVSDFTVQASDTKLSRDQAQTLTLIPTPDLLKSLIPHKKQQQTIGFCLADPELLLETAAQKLKDKQLDAIIANPPASIGSPHRDATILTASGNRMDLTGVSILRLAYEILQLISVKGAPL